MSSSPPLTAADRFALALDGLCAAVAARIAGRAMEAAMILLVWQRVRRIRIQVLGLLVRFRAGLLVVRATPRAVTGGWSRADAGARRGLPRGLAWLLQLVPFQAACFAGQIREVLAEPEMVGLLAAAPQARRVLAPLCRMLGIADVVGTASRRRRDGAADDVTASEPVDAAADGRTGATPCESVARAAQGSRDLGPGWDVLVWDG